jgi:hypothetical protein
VHSKRLKQELRGHHVRTVQEMGWSGTSNGALLRLAESQFEAFVTVDQGISFQQNLAGLSIGVVVLVAPSNSFDDLQPLFGKLNDAIKGLKPGAVLVVS